MNSTDSFTTESLTSIDDGNGSLVDDWETYKSYTRFYYITDEVFLYANPILIIIGIPTHALSMVIFLRKRMRRYPVSVFMAMLSLTNILILAGPVTMQWLNHKLFIGFVVTGSRFLCSFHVYIDLVGSSINSWLILMIAIERYLSVTKPFLIRTSFNRRQAWIIVFSVFLVAILAPLGIAFVASKAEGCLLFFSKTYQIIGSIQIFFIYVLPWILILTLSIITVHKLRNRIRTRASRRIHISVMLITVSFSFITFTMPYQICWYWLFSNAMGSVTLNLKVNILNIGFRYLALTIRNLNYTLNFFLYSLTSIVFLKEAFTIAHCNYFFNQTMAERNYAIRRFRRFLSLRGQADDDDEARAQDENLQTDGQSQRNSSFISRRSSLRVRLSLYSKKQTSNDRKHTIGSLNNDGKSRSSVALLNNGINSKKIQTKTISLKIKKRKSAPTDEKFCWMRTESKRRNHSSPIIFDIERTGQSSSKTNQPTSVVLSTVV